MKNLEKIEKSSKKSLIGPVISIILGMFMVGLDNSILDVAIPDIVNYFGSDLLTIQWSITGYALAVAAVIPLAGWMCDRFGTKQVFVTIIALFTIGSGLCSIAASPLQLIIFRIIQGIGGGMVIPVGIATTYRIAPKEKLGSFMGFIGLGMVIAPTIGPVVSGYILKYASWHWLFLINIPMGILTIIINIIFLPKFEVKSVPHLDIYGMILAPIAFTALVYAVNEGNKSWTSSSSIISLTIGIIALILFVFAELSQNQPLLELRVLSIWKFSSGLIALSIFQISLFSASILTPLFLQYIKGYSALYTGSILLTQALASGIIGQISGRLFDKIGAKLLAISSLILTSITLFMLSRISENTSATYIILCVIVLGFGAGLIWMPLNSHMLRTVPQDLISRVTSLTGAFQQIICSFAIAGMTGFLTSRITFHTTDARDKLNASILSYNEAFLLCAAIAIVGIIFSLIIKNTKAEAEISKV